MHKLKPPISMLSRSTAPKTTNCSYRHESKKLLNFGSFAKIFVPVILSSIPWCHYCKIRSCGTTIGHKQAYCHASCHYIIMICRITCGHNFLPTSLVSTSAMFTNYLLSDRISINLLIIGSVQFSSCGTSHGLKCP